MVLMISRTLLAILVLMISFDIFVIERLVSTKLSPGCNLWQTLSKIYPSPVLNATATEIEVLVLPVQSTYL